MVTSVELIQPAEIFRERFIRMLRVKICGKYSKGISLRKSGAGACKRCF